MKEHETKAEENYIDRPINTKHQIQRTRKWPSKQWSTFPIHWRYDRPSRNITQMSAY